MKSIILIKLRKLSSVGWRTRILILLALFFLLIPNSLPTRTNAADGDLDLSFGSGGKVVTDFFGNYDSASAIAAYPNGKVVVVGSTRSPNDNNAIDIALARYNRDGSLDQSFGSGGLVITDFNAVETAQAVAIQPDSKIVVAATISHAVNTSEFALIRYNRDGSLDQSFGVGGVVTTTFSGVQNVPADLAITPRGDILIAGSTNTGESSISWDFAIAQFDRNGNLDQTFGTGGKVTIDFGGNDMVKSLLIRPGGEIILVGNTSTYPGGGQINTDVALAFLNRDGNLDFSFGTDGKMTTDITGLSGINDATLQPDGKIIAAGTVSPAPGGDDFIVVRFDRDGSLDQTFGTGGIVTTDFASSDDFGFAVAVGQKGKIVVVGRTNSGTLAQPRTFEDFAVARYNRDGSLDQTFGTGGLVTTDFFSGNIDEARAVVILPNGRIIAAGQTWDARNQPVSQTIDFALAAYEWR